MCRVRTVVRLPAGLRDVGTDAYDLAGDRGVTDGVQTRAAVSSGNDNLDAELLDEAVIEDRASVVAVVEGGQAADRHVDHVHVALLGHEDHAFDEGVCRTA